MVCSSVNIGCQARPSTTDVTASSCSLPFSPCSCPLQTRPSPSPLLRCCCGSAAQLQPAVLSGDRPAAPARPTAADPRPWAWTASATSLAWTTRIAAATTAASAQRPPQRPVCRARSRPRRRRPTLPPPRPLGAVLPIHCSATPNTRTYGTPGTRSATRTPTRPPPPAPCSAPPSLSARRSTSGIVQASAS